MGVCLGKGRAWLVVAAERDKCVEKTLYSIALL